MVELLSYGFRDSTHYYASQGAIATTWIVSFQQIRSLHEDAATILSYTTCLEPKAIPRALLPPLDSEQRMTRALGTLCGYSFLSKREDGETFDMHSLVHLATQLWSEEEEIEAETLQMAYAHIAKVFPYDDWEDRGLCRQYMPHVLRLLIRTDSANTRDRCLLGYKVGTCLTSEGQTRQAVHILESVVEVERTNLAENNPSRLASQHALASAYNSNGQIKQAIKLLEYVVTIQADILAENHPNQLASQHALALAYNSNGQIKEAIQLLEYVVAVQADTLAENHPNQLSSQHVLALTYHSNGQIKEAIELFERVVAVRTDILAENHTNRLASEHSLGVVYQENGQTKEAVELLEHVVAVQAIALSEDDRRRQLSIEWLQYCYDMLEEVGIPGESDGSEPIDAM